jgi:outer membrane protein TolC
MLADLRERRASAAARLNAQLDRPPDAPLGLPGDDDLALDAPPIEELLATALADRPEVNMGRARVALTAAAIRMGEVMNRPQATQGYSQFERGMMPEASESEPLMPYGTMRKFTDRPAYAQTEAYLAEMRRRLAAEQSSLRQVEADTRALARAWLADFDIARRAAALAEQIALPQGRSAYESALGAYTAGATSFTDLQSAQRNLVDAQLELHRARRDLSQTALRRATLTGRLPLNKRP